MSIVEVKVPQLSESVSEATLLQWKKTPGAAVNADEILVEVETDKVVLEVPAPAKGVARSNCWSPTALRWWPDRSLPGSTAPPRARRPTARGRRRPQLPAATAAPSRAGDAGGRPPAGRERTQRKRDHGHGPRWPRDQGDVLRTPPAQAPASAPAPAARPVAGPAGARSLLGGAPLPDVRAPIDLSPLANRPEQRVPMSRLRQRVAERLVQSQSTAAILTTFNEVNMQPVDRPAQPVQGPI